MTTTLIPQEEQAPYEELDYRESDGIKVSLLWSRTDESLLVALFDARTGESFELPVEPRRALDAFRHPFAFAASGNLVPERSWDQVAV